MKTTSTAKRRYPAKPIKQEPVHQMKVVDMETARGLLRTIYMNLKQAIDQETLVDFRKDGNSTDVAFVMGSTELKFNLKEGGPQC